MKIKRGDTVRVIAGRDTGREGRILLVDQKKNRVIVEGVNMVQKHIKPNKNRKYQQGGIVSMEAAIDASNIMYLHKGQPTRLGYLVETTEIDGKTVKTKQRFAKSTGEVID